MSSQRWSMYMYVHAQKQFSVHCTPQIHCLAQYCCGLYDTQPWISRITHNFPKQPLFFLVPHRALLGFRRSACVCLDSPQAGWRTVSWLPLPRRTDSTPATSRLNIRQTQCRTRYRSASRLYIKQTTYDFKRKTTHIFSSNFTEFLLESRVCA